MTGEAFTKYSLNSIRHNRYDTQAPKQDNLNQVSVMMRRQGYNDSGITICLLRSIHLLFVYDENVASHQKQQ